MSECTDSELGVLLLAYELGALPPEEIERFEMHLLECDHCLNEVKSFRQETALLAGDSEVKSITEAKSRMAVESKSLPERILGAIWPKTSFVLKPAVMYAVILLMLIPAYYGLRRDQGSAVTEISQTLELVDRRDDSIGSFNRDQGEWVLLTFQHDSAEVGESYHLTIESEDGEVIHDNPEYRGFDWTRRGKLQLRLSDFEPGKYRLLITDLNSDSSSRMLERLFRVDQ
jgi:hypothetical protein